MKYNIPDRKFCSEEKKMVSMRLPTDLMKKVRRIAADKGWEVTDLVMTVLDQYAQWEEKVSKR